MATRQLNLLEGDEGEMGSYQPMTKNGHPLGEVASALQKCIRRGLEDQALYWAMELEASGFFQYVWKRLAIMASEDVGLGDSRASVLVQSLWQTYDTIRKNQQKGQEVDPDILGHAVLYLCRCRKNHLVVTYVSAILARIKGGWRPEIPDFALDMHTQRGRQMKRTEEDWWRDGARLVGGVLLEGELEYEAEARGLTADQVLDERNVLDEESRDG